MLKILIGLAVINFGLAFFTFSISNLFWGIASLLASGVVLKTQKKTGKK